MKFIKGLLLILKEAVGRLRDSLNMYIVVIITTIIPH